MVAIVTGCGGVVGSAAVDHLITAGWHVVGLDNDMRAQFFGAEGSTANVVDRLTRYDGFIARNVDIRDDGAVREIFRDYRPGLVMHTAAQPSHDWAAKAPHIDFAVNATGTLNLLEATRQHVPDATFAHISTSKVYGDHPNALPLDRQGERLDVPCDHRYWNGIDTSMSIDQSTHSLFGVSKAAGDLLAQEYGRYFDMPTVVFRPGCVTGPAHAAVELHGFLAYLMRCTVTGRPYTVFGYDGLQVRCNIHADDLVAACLAYHERPRPGAVYNIGGGRTSSCSMLEAIAACERIADRELDWTYSPIARIGDHKWWISDIAEFQSDYPSWGPSRDLEQTLREIHEENIEHWTTICG